MPSPSSPLRDNSEESGDEAEPPPSSSEERRARDAFLASAAGLIAQEAWDDLSRFVDLLPGGSFVAFLVIGMCFSWVLHTRRLASARMRMSGWFGPVSSQFRALFTWLTQKSRRANRVSEWLRAIWPWAAIGYKALVIGVLAGLFIWIGSLGVVRLGHTFQPCDSAQELHVITAPENVYALRLAAAEFADEQRVGNCPRYRISIGAAPSIDEMIYGFDNKWERQDVRQEGEPFVRLLGPRPDAWIATSSGEATYVKQRVNAARVTFTPGPSVATDSLTIGMFGDGFDVMERALGPKEEEGYKLKRLVTTARSAPDMRLIYPQPGLSSAGLIAASELDELTKPGDIAHSVVFDDSVSALLCRLKKAGTAEREKYALIVPSHSVEDYNKRSLTDEGCPGDIPSGQDALKAFSSSELSILDYPFFTVTWSGENNSESHDALKAFGDWMGNRKLFRATSISEGKSPVKDATVLHDMRNRLNRELPGISLHLVLDASRSMLKPPSAWLLRTREAFPIVQRTLIPTDRLSLSRFYTAGAEPHVTKPGRRVNRYELDDLVQKIAARTPAGSDASISEMLEMLPPYVDRLGSTVVVITDGGVFDNESGERAIAEAVTSAHRVRNLYILVLGDIGCGGKYPPGNPELAGKHIVCAEAGQDLEKGLREMVSVVRGWSP